MNFLGNKKDNTHKGDTEIQNGSLSVDGDLIVDGSINVNDINVNDINVNSLTIGDPPYTLPTEAGTEGQVIIMNADNTTSDWKDLTSGTARIWQNLFTMREPNITSNKFAYIDFDASSYGSKSINTDDFPVGSIIKQDLEGQFLVLTTGNLSCSTSIKITAFGNDYLIYQPIAVNTGNSIAALTGVRFGYWSITTTYTRISATEILLGSLSINVNFDNVNNPTGDFKAQAPVKTSLSSPSIDLPVTITGFTPSTIYPINMTVQDFSASGANTTMIANRYTIDLCTPNTSILATSENLTTDHTLLSNLTAGDAGHTQFALLAGRNGGQVLSGGITPLHNLKLKSHTAGLDNITIKDLNTEFNKNIDMDDNEIIDCNNIRTNISPIFTINKNGSNATELYGNSTIRRIQVSNRVYLLSGTDLDMGTGDIINSTNTNKIDMDDTNDIVLESGSGNIKLNSDLNMNSNNTINQDNITFIDNARLDNVNNGFSLRNSRDGPTDNIFIAPGENIFYKNINLQSGANMTFPFANNSIGSPITGNLNNLYVNNINGLTPVGGIFAGTADSLVYNPSVDGAIEKSIMPTAIVGSLTVPANGFAVGDSFHLVLAGDFNSNNGDTLNIRLYGGPTSTVLLANLPVPLVGSAGVSFEVEVDFQLRAIGGAGVADICSNFDFTYNGGGGGNFRGERGVFQNNTTFDTTVNNVLLVTAQYSSTNANNSMKTIVSKLSKTY